MEEMLIKTPYGDLSVRDTKADREPILLIHGNTSCKEIFRHQFDSPLADRFRLIAFDLPGHGASSNAPDPDLAYNLSGYAGAAIEVLEKLHLSQPLIYGWSLGGHIALDMLSRRSDISGIMISGTPPIPANMEGAGQGFMPTPLFQLTGKGDLTPAEAETYARGTVGPSAEFAPFMLDAAIRTHGQARAMFAADFLSGRHDDQRAIVQSSKVPLAVVNGADDVFINHAYFDSVAFANLWEGKVHALAGIGHAPFWEAPLAFNTLLDRFASKIFHRS
jgi:pimeloyl-ACP methyl ester carboxylesterase